MATIYRAPFWRKLCQTILAQGKPINAATIEQYLKENVPYVPSQEHTLELGIRMLATGDIAQYLPRSRACQ